MPRYLTEAIGTFFLVLAVCLCVIYAGALAPIGIGLMLMVMVYMGGHISGAHFNPAVTFALYLSAKMKARDVMPYMGAQVLGGVAGAMLAWFIAGQTINLAPAESANSLQALLTEVIFTFALALVVLNVACAAKTKGNSFYGAAIGLTLAAGIFAGGSISGGAFNPAVGIGPTLAHMLLGDGGLNHLWLYLVGPLAGGGLAAAVFAVQERGGDAA
jgi:aquaporin Z